MMSVSCSHEPPTHTKSTRPHV